MGFLAKRTARPREEAGKGQLPVLLGGLTTAREASDQTHILMPAGGKGGVHTLLQNGTGADWAWGRPRQT